jgi:SAM-dependent methyltransferase
MSSLTELRSRLCPVCGRSPGEATPFLDSSFDQARVNDFSFASRKAPEYMSFRLVRCTGCATVYAAEAPTAEALAGAYHVADYDSAEEAELAAATYAEAIAPQLTEGDPRGTAVDVGTGSGDFLRHLRAMGFRDVVGIEPSTSAIAAARADVRPAIREGIFEEGSFPPETLSLVSCFQTLEHVPEPREFVASAFRLLQPGGVLALVTHDYTSLVNRLMGRRSPIIDIEHMQLFCPESLRHLVSECGFEDVSIRQIRNRYPLRYWARLAPLPRALKGAAKGVLAGTGLGRRTLAINVGNVLTFARRPSLT